VRAGRMESMWTDFFAKIPDEAALIIRLYLLGGDVLATLAVGFGIVWEGGPMEVHHVAHRLVIWGVIVETLCSVALFTFDEGINSVQQTKILALEARPWSKANFDALQKLKGKVTDVGVYSERGCIECGLFAWHIELALHAAGVRLYADDSIDWMRGTGIMVRLPKGSDLANNPLFVALRDAGLNPGVGFHNETAWSPVRTDIPVIFVGEKFPLLAEFPFFPSGQSQWTILPLANPGFVPPNPAANRATNQMHLQLGPKQ
jgi:hypothetical protein